MATDQEKLLIRMEVTQRKFEKQLAAASNTVDRRAHQMENRFKKANKNIAKTFERGFFRRSNTVFRQLGYQLQDFAVQVQGGTSAVTAFTQQGSQMISVFGPMGAIMGAVLAVGLPLAASIIDLGDASEEAKNKAKTFADKLNETESAIANASRAAQLAGRGGLEDLGRMFGELTTEVSELALALYDIEKRAALLKIGEVLSTITQDIAKATAAASGAVGEALSQAGTQAAIEEAAAYREEIERIQAAIDARKAAGQFVDPAEITQLREMREELAAMEGDLSSIGSLVGEIALSPDLITGLSEAQTALEAAQAAGDFAEIADQLSTIRDLLKEAGDVISQDVIDGVTQAEKQARLMATTLDEGKAAAEGIANVDIAGNIGAGADEAARLAQNLGISLATAARLAALGPQGISTGEKGRGGAVDPRTVGGRAIDIQTAEAGEFLANYKAPKVGGGGGRNRGSGGGGGRKQPGLFENAEREIKALERRIEMIGKTDAEVAKLTSRYKLLDEAKKRGLDLDARQAASGRTLREEIDQQAEAVARLTREAEQYQAQADFMEGATQQLKDGFIDAIVEGESFSDVLKDVAKSLAKAALQAALFGDGPFGGGIGKGGKGLLGGLFGGLFGGGKGLLSFDGGGFTGHGARTGGLDGKGGFPAILHPGEHVIDGMKGGKIGGNSVVQVVLSPDLEARILQQASDRSIQITQAGVSANNRAIQKRQNRPGFG